MSLADDLQKLEQMRASGSLTEEEFQQAKKKLLSSPEPRPDVVPSRVPESPGGGAHRDVSYQIIMGLFALIIFMLFMLALFRPHWFPGHEWFHWHRY